MTNKHFKINFFFVNLDEIIHLIVDINGNLHAYRGDQSWRIDLKEYIQEENFVVETFSIELVASDIILDNSSNMDLKNIDNRDTSFGYIATW